MPLFDIPRGTALTPPNFFGGAGSVTDTAFFFCVGDFTPPNRLLLLATLASLGGRAADPCFLECLVPFL